MRNVQNIKPQMGADSLRTKAIFTVFEVWAVWFNSLDYMLTRTGT